MARVLSAVGFCVVAAVLAACGQGSLTPPKPAPQPDIETRVLPLKQQREMPRLIAPPPAYGNKVVMARRSGPHSSN